MGKKILILVAVCLTVTLASAIYGGETISYTFPKCNYLTINISNCEANEWKAQGCTEDSICNFYCSCYDNYILHLTPAVNSVGNFTIAITNYYFEEGQEPARQIIYYGANGLTWSCSYCDMPLPGYACTDENCIPSYNCTNGKCLSFEGLTPIVETRNITNISIIQPITVNDTLVSPIPEEIDYTPYAIGIIIIFITCIFVWYTHTLGLFKKRKETTPIEDKAVG